MTAGIFAAHGVWIGRCRSGACYNLKGFFENIKIKRIIIQQHKAIVHDGLLATKKPGFKEKVLESIHSEGYTEGPWLWKGSAMYWPAFFEFEPRFVVVSRPREQIFKSCRNSHIFGDHLSGDELYANIDFHQEQMEYLVTFKQAVRVNSFDVMQGDFTSIKKAIEYCGIEFSDALTSGFVDEKLWTFRASPSDKATSTDLSTATP